MAIRLPGRGAGELQILMIQSRVGDFGAGVQLLLFSQPAAAREAYRILGKAVPKHQDDMIDWAVDSQDAVYTNAGAAYRTLGKIFDEQPTCEHQWIDARNKVVQSGEMCPKCGVVRA